MLFLFQWTEDLASGPKPWKKEYPSPVDKVRPMGTLHHLDLDEERKWLLQQMSSHYLKNDRRAETNVGFFFNTIAAICCHTAGCSLKISLI